MVHNDILKIYKSYFPEESSNIEAWFPNGKNSIRVRMKNRTEFVCTLNGKNNWRYDTIDSFISNTMKGATKM